MIGCVCMINVQPASLASSCVFRMARVPSSHGFPPPNGAEAFPRGHATEPGQLVVTVCSDVSGAINSMGDRRMDKTRAWAVGRLERHALGRVLQYLSKYEIPDTYGGAPSYTGHHALRRQLVCRTHVFAIGSAHPKHPCLYALVPSFRTA